MAAAAASTKNHVLAAETARPGPTDDPPTANPPPDTRPPPRHRLPALPARRRIRTNSELARELLGLVSQTIFRRWRCFPVQLGGDPIVVGRSGPTEWFPGTQRTALSGRRVRFWAGSKVSGLLQHSLWHRGRLSNAVDDAVMLPKCRWSKMNRPSSTRRRCSSGNHRRWPNPLPPVPFPPTLASSLSLVVRLVVSPAVLGLRWLGCTVGVPGARSDRTCAPSARVIGRFARQLSSGLRQERRSPAPVSYRREAWQFMDRSKRGSVAARAARYRQ